MKIVINKCFGGFHPSKKAILKMMERGCPHIRKSPLTEWVVLSQTIEETRKTVETFYGYPIIDDEVITEEHRSGDRDCQVLVEVVELLGKEVDSRFSELKIVEIPDGVEWEIDEYDGVESIHEKHKIWG